MVFLGVTIILTIYDPIVTFVIIIFLSLFYSCVLIITKKTFNTIGDKRLSANKERFRLTNQTINGIKEIKVLSKEKFF